MVVSGVLAVPGVGPGPVVLPPLVAALLAASIVTVSGVLTVPGVGPVVVGISRMISAAVPIGLSSQVPRVAVGEVAFPGILVVVHSRRNLRHRNRNDSGLEDWMRVDAANIPVVLLASLSEILSLHSLVPRIEVPGNFDAFWVLFLISETGLLESL